MAEIVQQYVSLCPPKIEVQVRHNMEKQEAGPHWPTALPSAGPVFQADSVQRSSSLLKVKLDSVVYFIERKTNRTCVNLGLLKHHTLYCHCCLE